MRIHHVALRTPDIAALEAFYAGVLGLTVTERRSPRSVWLDAAGTLLMLETRGDGEPAVPAGSQEMVAFAVTPETIADYMERLARGGVTIESRTTYTIYFRDPDGRRVGLSAYPRSLE